MRYRKKELIMVWQCKKEDVVEGMEDFLVEFFQLFNDGCFVEYANG